MSEFHAILVEGLFYERDGALHIEQDDGTHVSWADTLACVVDQRVQLAIHHLPPNGIEPDEPGAGSCKFPGGVGCPVRHDTYPTRLLSFHMEGVLRVDPWRLEKFDGSVVALPLQGMTGHFGRVGVATVVDVEKMREQLAASSPEKMAEMLAASGVNAGDLQNMLDRLRRIGQQ